MGGEKRNREKRPLNYDQGYDDVNGGDLHEYEEGVAEEESRENKRVANYEFELPDDFEDENVESEDADDDNSLEGKSHLTILTPLEGKPGYNKLKESIIRMQKDTRISVVYAPLPKPCRERPKREVLEGLIDKVFSNKWVKRNRETPTGYYTVGAIASEFQPRTEFEMTMASELNDNEVSVEDRIAKMRSKLLCIADKSKPIKKINSKTFRRIKNKNLKKSRVVVLMDPDMAKEEERMTLKHKNKGKWAKRVRSRRLDVNYDETLAAIAEQLEINTTLSIKDASSSDEEECNDGSDEDTCKCWNPFSQIFAFYSKLISKAKEKTLKTMEDDQVPISYLLSFLPFMARAMKKKNEEAKRALEEYEEPENSGIGETPKKSTKVGSRRRVFGAAAKVKAPKESKKESDNFFDKSDSSDNEDNASPARNSMETEKLDDVKGNK